MNILNSFVKSIHRFPNNSNAREVWQKALHGQKCSSSNNICIKHFTPDDYRVSKDGKRITLKADAVPSVFDVLLIELKEGEDIECAPDKIDLNECDTKYPEVNEPHDLELENRNLRQEIERLKCMLESERIVSKSLDDRFKEIKQQQAKELEDLKQQIDYLKKSLQNERDVKFSGLNVNILNVNLSIYFLNFI